MKLPQDVEFFEKIRREIGAFVLVAEGYDADVSRAFKGSDGYLLSKPIDEADAQRLLTALPRERADDLLTRLRAHFETYRRGDGIVMARPYVLLEGVRRG